MADLKPAKLDTSTGEVRQFESGNTVGVAHGGTGLATVASKALLYASALDTVAALAAGTNGYVLTMVSGSPAWAAPSAGSFVACEAYKTDVQTLTSSESWITFDAESIDTDGFHSTSSNTDRLTIPTGLGGYYLVYAGIAFTGNNGTETNESVLRFAINGTASTQNQRSSGCARWGSERHPFTITLIALLSLSEGDYVTVGGTNASNAGRIGDGGHSQLSAFGCLKVG